MIFITGVLIIFLVIISYRRILYRYVFQSVLKCIKMYLYLWDNIVNMLPMYIYNKTYNHRTSDLDYSVYEYWYKYNNKYYKFKGIEDDIYKFNDACKLYNPQNMKLINHCCVIDKNDKYIKDITDEIRKFMYYRGVIEWKYILVHLDINMNNKICFYMNDINMTEKYYDIVEIYDKKFNF